MREGPIALLYNESDEDCISTARPWTQCAAHSRRRRRFEPLGCHCRATAHALRCDRDGCARPWQLGSDRRVVGFSLGGAVALALALDFPERVEKLAVIGTVSGRTPEEKAKALQRIAFLKQHGRAAIADANRERWFSDEFREAHPDLVERRVAQVVACDPASYLHAFTVFCTSDFADRLEEVDVPTLIITGEHDTAATPRMAQLMGERIRDSRVHVLPRLRHSVLIEAPKQVGALLEGFL
jgi:(E)-2-((N-methylformamido)methylene)succinate hydrolase